MYDKDYFAGNETHPGSDICRKYDIHWWSYRYYAGLVKKYCRAGTVLELGCAHGYLLSFLDDNKYEKIGKDLSAYALGLAAQNNPSAKLILGSVESLNEISSNSVDIIISKYVFEHLDHPERAVDESYRCLKANGIIIISVPNTSSLLRHAKGEMWIGDRDPTHKSVLTPLEWRNIFQNKGFAIIKTFSDGFWDVPYLPVIPTFIQLLMFSIPTVLQTLFVVQMLPVRLGENLILVARKTT
jgi:SAM-dependent methyltransferase